MTVELTVTEVRDALDHAASQEEGGAGHASTLLLGRLFHEIQRELVGPSTTRNGLRILPELDRDREVWRRKLLDHTYQLLVGPRLAQNRAYLQNATEAVLEFWEAVRELCDWLTEVVWAATEEHPLLPAWEPLAPLFHAEVEPACELSRPDWREPVRLTRVADGLLRVPQSGAFCATELQLGKTLPALELGQAALYHLMLSRSSEHTPPARRPTALVLVRFTPKREELVLDAATVAHAEEFLMNLIGELSGVQQPAAKVEGVAVSPEAHSAAREPTSYDELIRRLARAFREYGTSVEIKTPPSVGPRFLRFEAELGAGVKFEHVQKLAPEIGLRLGTEQDPIIIRAQGRVLIDVPRPDPRAVPFDVVPAALGALGSPHGSARLAVGVGVDDSVRFADLSDPNNAHVVVVGTTGSGKTEWLRSAIASLLIGNTPGTLRLVLIDPKQTAFDDLRGSPFLWDEYGFWVPDADASIGDVLQMLVREMERRYDLLAQTATDDLGRYIERTGHTLPRIVVFCDEYYALVTQASRAEKKHIEKAVGLLGSKARAAGIHLVLAMQQASRRVLEGTISANFPCRVALLTSSDSESRMVIGRSGASQLTGGGDLLYRDIGDPVRLQAPYLDEAARERWFARR